MAPPFLPQVMPRADARLDFSPISQGLDSIRDQRNKNAMMDMRREEMDRNEALARERMGAAAARQNAMMAFQREQYQNEAPMREAQLDLLRARAVAARRPPQSANRTYELGDRIVQMQPDGTFKEVYQRPKSPMELYIERKLTGAAGGGAAPEAPPAGVIPQSAPMEPERDGQDPFLQPTAGVQPVAQPGQAQGGLSDLTPDDLSIMKAIPRYAPLAKAIEDQRAAENAGTTLDKSNIKAVQEEMRSLDQQLVNLNRIKNTFDPDYLTLLGRAKFEALKLRAKSGLDVARLSPAEQEQVKSYAEFRQNAAVNINEYIRAMTGAAMSNDEAKRLMLGQANAGQGFFDGDDPVSFKSKLDNAIEGATIARARAFYLAKQGKFSPRDFAEGGKPPISLQGMRRQMIKTRRRLLQEAKSNNLGPSWVRDKMREEYGI